MDLRTLLDAALDAPDEVGPRLVLADFLLEQEDPMGELIALQCALDAPETVHPRHALASARRLQLPILDASRSEQLERLRALLEEREKKWLARHGLKPGEGSFVRGLLALTLSAARLCEVAPAFGEALPATSLRMVEPWPRLPEALAYLHQLVGVSTLHLDNLSFDLGGLQQLARAALPPRMAALHLSRNEIGPLGARILASSAWLGRLSRLYLDHTGLKPEGAHALAEGALPCLALLDLSANRVGPEGLQALLDSPNLPGLEALHLRANRLGLEGALALAESPRLAGLRVLNLGFNDIGDEGVRALADSPHASSLTALDLAYNRVTDEGAMTLATSPHLGSLTSLQIGANGLTSRAQRALTERFGSGVLF